MSLYSCSFESGGKTGLDVFHPGGRLVLAPSLALLVTAVLRRAAPGRPAVAGWRLARAFTFGSERRGRPPDLGVETAPVQPLGQIRQARADLRRHGRIGGA